MFTVLMYVTAAIAEIAGCFAFWCWYREGKPIFWLLPGMLSLASFAWLLSLSPAEYAGRAYAIYGGIYIATTLGWLWAVEGILPDRWDIIGATISLIGAAIILWLPVHNVSGSFILASAPVGILLSHKNRTHSSPRLFVAASLYISGIRIPANMRLSASFVSRCSDSVGTSKPIEVVRLPSHS